MAISQVTPLAWNTPIVDEKGNPTPYFQRQLQQLLKEKATTDALAAGAVPQGDVLTSGLTSAAHTVIGNKEAAAGPLEELTASQVLDLLGSTQGDLIYRDASGWAVLAPGTSGQFLKTQGAAANPLWATVSSSGGGGAWSVITEQTLSVDGTPTAISSIPAGYRDIILVVSGRSNVAALEGGVTIQFNGDTAANYDYINNWQVVTAVGASQAVAATSIQAGILPGDTSTALEGATAEIYIPNYTGTTFHKHVRSSTGDKKSNATGQLGTWNTAGFWRSTAAISSIQFVSGLKAGSVVTLYGRGGSASTSGAWKELLYYDFTTNGAAATLECDVTGYKEILCTGMNQLSSATVQRCIQVSTNGGTSWYTTSGDYADVLAAGGTSPNAAFFGHNTAVTNARDFSILIMNNGFNRTEPSAYVYTRATQQVFRGNGGGGSMVTTPINRVRLMGSAAGSGTPSGSFTAGQFQVLAR